MTSKFLRKDLWPTITSLIRKSKRNFVAVAYLGQGGKKLLPLHRGDVLIIDMSIASVKSGQTNPSEIAKFIQRGVLVHNLPNLHAKVFVFDRAAVIGSCNASRRSKNLLIEAGLLTTDPGAVEIARAFVESFMVDPVSPKYVRECQKIYRPPRIPGAGKRSSRIAEGPRMWIQRLTDDDDKDAKKARVRKSGIVEAKKRMRSNRRYTLEDANFAAEYKIPAQAQLGDCIVQIYKEDKVLEVYPPSRILFLKPFTSKRGAAKKFVFYETPKKKAIPFSEFKRRMKKLGWRNIGEDVGREVTDPEMQYKIRAFWPGS